MGKTRNYEGKAFECIQLSKYTNLNGTSLRDTNIRLYGSMLVSEAFRDLTDRQKLLYILCKDQYYGKRKPKQDYRKDGFFQEDDNFYMSWRTIQGYGLYTKTSSKNFYADMKELQEHGFIECVSKGKGKHKSIYQYSAKWRKWAKD